MNAGDGKAGGAERGNRHVQPLMHAARLNIAAHGSMLMASPSDPVEPGGGIHPAIGADNKQAGKHPADSDEKPAAPMHPRTNAVPAVEENPESDRFQEKCGAFPRKRHPYNWSCVFHKFWPEKTQVQKKAPFPKPLRSQRISPHPWTRP